MEIGESCAIDLILRWIKLCTGNPLKRFKKSIRMTLVCCATNYRQWRTVAFKKVFLLLFLSVCIFRKSVVHFSPAFSAPACVSKYIRYTKQILEFHYMNENQKPNISKIKKSRSITWIKLRFPGEKTLEIFGSKNFGCSVYRISTIIMLQRN